MAGQQLESLGRYKLQRVLGKGAMGVVYEGLDPRLNRRVAIKTILVGNLDEATARDYSKRFAREAQAVARLNHPNIVQVYDYGEEGEIAYIVMEYVRGKELKSSFDASEQFEIGTAVRLMTELLGAMDFAHNAGVIHRDIKPANVMVDTEGRAKLADFGVARISDPDSQTGATQAGTMVGTPAYMSPEQIQGQKIDRRTDIFSAGVILYQFLTGQKPFQGGGAWTMAKKIVHDDPPAPSSIFASVSPGFDRVVSRALAKHPDNRYQSAQQFADALQRVLEGRSPEDEGAPEVFVDDDPTFTPVVAEADQQGSEVELEFWRAIKDTDDAEELELYLEEFPQGVYRHLAQQKLAVLRHPGGQAGFDADEARARQAEAERLQHEAEARAKREAEERARREAEARARQEAEERAKKSAAEEKAREKARLEAELVAQLEAQARAKREAEEQARREAVAKAKREAEEKASREAEARAKREAEEKARREAEEKARREAEEKARREAEEKARREAEEKARREAEAKAKREAEEKARREAEEKARREAEEKARRVAEERARREAEAKAKREAEEKARREAEEKARREAEEKARLEAEARARREAEEKLRREAEAKARREAEEKARREAAEQARIEAEARAKREAEEKARREAEAKARREAEEEAQREAEAKARREAEERALREAEAKARHEAEEKARREAEAKARKIAEEKARREAENRARIEAEARLWRESQQRAMRDAEKKAVRANEMAMRREARERAEREAEEAAAHEAKERARLEHEAWERRVEAEKAKLAAETAAKRAARVKAQREHDERVKGEVEGLLRQQKVPAAPVNAAGAAPASSKSPKFLASLLGAFGAEKPPTPADLYEKARALERTGRIAEAVNLLQQAANGNSGVAARRLGEIYANGSGNVPRDPKLSARWFSVAETLGEKVSRAKGSV